MAAEYPTNVPSLRPVTGTTEAIDANGVDLHAADHDELASEVNAIGADLVTARGASGTIAARLAAIDATVAGKDPAGTASTAVASHVAAADPHPQYLTSAEGTAAYDALGSASAAVASHEADTTNVHGITNTSALYRAGGTDVSISDGGTGASDAPTARSNLGLGTSAVKNSPTTGNAAPAEVVLGSDTRLTDSRTPTAHVHDGADITTGTFAYGRLPIGTTASTVAAGDDSRFTNSRTPTGTAGGDLAGTYPNPTLGTTGVAAGTYGSSGTQHAQVEVDAKGRVISAASVDNTFVAFGGLVTLGHSYTQYGPSTTLADSFANWTHRLAAALNIPSDEVFLWGKGGAMASTAATGDGTDNSGAGLVLRHLYPNHFYTYSQSANRLGRSFPALFVLMYGINDAARQWANTSTITVPAYTNGVRSMVSRCRACEVHDSRDATVAYSGFSTTVSNETIQTGPSYRKSTTNGDTITITIPTDFPGGTLAVSFLGCTGNRAFLNGAVNSSTTTIVLNTGLGGTYVNFANGDVILVDSEQMLISAGGGTASLTVTRGYNGTTAASHVDVSPVSLPTTTARVNWSGTASGMTGNTALAGQGAAAASVPVRSRIPVVKRWTLTAADAGKTIIATVAGIVGNEDVAFDGWWIEDASPPTVLLVNQFRSAFPGTSGFFTGSSASAINGALATVAAEFDASVQVVDLATAIGNETEATPTGSITSSQTSIPVTLTSGTASLIGPGSVLRFDDTASIEEMFCTAISGTGTSRTLTVTRGFNGTTAAAHAATAKIYDVRYVATADRIHPSDQGHARIAAAVIQTIAGLTRSYNQIAGGAGYGANRNQALRDGYYVYTRGTRNTFGGAAQSTAYAIPLYIPQPCTVQTMGIEIVTTAGGVGSVTRLGIYRESQNGKPGQLLLDAGTVASTTTGAKEITGLWAALRPGWYWMVAVAQGSATTPTYRSVNALTIPYTIPTATAPSGASPNTQGLSCTLVSGALPAIWNATGVEAAESNLPVIWAKITTPIRD